MLATPRKTRPAARPAPRTETAQDRRDRMVEQNLSLVYEVAWQVKRRVGDHVTLEELVSAGTLGLLDALDRFDPARGLKLSTFVLPRIRGAILDDLRRRDWMPRRVRSQSRFLAEAQRQLEQRHARAARAAEVAEQLAVDLERYWRIRDDASAALLPLERMTGTSSDVGLEEVVADEERPGPDARILEQERLGRISAALAALPERERAVLSLTYFEELPGNEIAGLLGVSESRVSQIKHRALGMLRAAGDLRELIA